MSGHQLRFRSVSSFRCGGHRAPFRPSDQLLVSWFPTLAHVRPDRQPGLWVHQHQIPGSGRENGHRIAGSRGSQCDKLDVVRSNKHVNKTTSGEDIQQ